MAERKFETSRIAGPGSHAAELFAELFETRQGEGYRLEAISLAGLYPRGGIAALTWIRSENGPTQKLGEFVTEGDLREQLRNFEWAHYGPALVSAMTADEADDVYLVVYERVPEGTAHWPRLFWQSRDFEAFKAELFDPKVPANGRKQYLRSAFVLERADWRFPKRFRGEPRFLGTMWPYGDEIFDWGVTYERIYDLDLGNMASSKRAHAMAVGGRPWIVAPAIEYFENSKGHTGVDLNYLTVWRDIFLTPWPMPHPLEPGNNVRVQNLHISWFDRPAAMEFVEQLDGKGFKLLSWAVRGTGADNVDFALNWVPANAEVEEREFIMTGPGDLSDAQDTSELHFVGDELGESVSPAALPWLGARHLGAGGRARPGPLGPPGLPGWHGPPRPDLEPGVPRGGHAPTHPFDVLMYQWMRQFGARAAQLAVNRKGELRFSRAYTWAEQGYPITKTYHRIRLGSVSKALTALPLVRHYIRLGAGPAEPGLDRPFGAELNIERSDPAFNAATVRQALAHTTGFDGNETPIDVVGLLRPQDVPGVDGGGVALGPAYQRHGEMRLALEAYPGDLITLPPGTQAYTNTLYVALSELWSHVHLPEQPWDRFDAAIRDGLLKPAQIDINPALTGNDYKQCVERNEVAYHAFPLEISRPDAADPERWLAAPYVFDTAAWSGSGGLSLSMREVARVHAMLTPRDGIAPYMTPEEKWVMAGTPTFGSSEPPLGWDFTLKDNLVPGVQALDHRMLQLMKNGAVGGNRAFNVHWFPGPGSTLDPDDTVDFAIAFNCSADVDPYAALTNAAWEVEDGGMWSPIDLTDGSDFDEEEP